MKKILDVKDVLLPTNVKSAEDMINKAMFKRIGNNKELDTKRKGTHLRHMLLDGVYRLAQDRKVGLTNLTPSKYTEDK